MAHNSGKSEDTKTTGDSFGLIPDNKDEDLSLARIVDGLMKLPQNLCKQQGICCRVATYKGGASLSWEEIQAVAKDKEAPGYETAKDFASVFLPYPSQEAVREIANDFVDRARDAATEQGQDAEKLSFFYCKYVLGDGRCGVHEDRPLGCRMYPLPHKNTIFHPGCGFEQQGVQNWHLIQRIMAALDIPEDFGINPSF